MIKILFVSETDGDLTQIAVAYARKMAPEGVHVISAGIKKTARIHPLVVKTMQEVDIDISYQMLLTLDDLPKNSGDILITLSEHSAKTIRLPLPGDPIQINWKLPNPLDAGGGESGIMRRTRERIAQMVEDFFLGGYHRAFQETNARSGYVLDSLKSGIIVHDIHRRITYFNSRAEEITGYRKKEVVGNDCHQVFDEKFCGDKCSFCDDTPDFDRLEYPLHVKRKNGTRIWVDFEVKSIRDSQGKFIGVLASFEPQGRPRKPLKKKGKSLVNFHGIFSQNPQMFKVFELVESVARTNVPVLIQGASGTGKELVARALHEESLRKDRVFLPINCGALPENLLESELFGYVKGAFTGAEKDKKGRFELAHGGTIFLDEIAEISPAMQVKLLRVLQEGTFERLGDTKTIRTDVRIVSATNKDLRQQVIEGKFREDLYYRLCVIPINLPLLRQRREDIPELARLFLRENEIGIETPAVLTPETVTFLTRYPWPGNIRELQNVLQYALIKSQGGEIQPRHLPDSLSAPVPETAAVPSFAGAASPSENWGSRPKGLTVSRVREMLIRTDGNKAKTARLLGVGRATLYRFLKNHPDVDR